MRTKPCLSHVSVRILTSRMHNSGTEIKTSNVSYWHRLLYARQRTVSQMHRLPAWLSIVVFTRRAESNCEHISGQEDNRKHDRSFCFANRAPTHHTNGKDKRAPPHDTSTEACSPWHRGGPGRHSAATPYGQAHERRRTT